MSGGGGMSGILTLAGLAQLIKTAQGGALSGLVKQLNALMKRRKNYQSIAFDSNPTHSPWLALARLLYPLQGPSHNHWHTGSPLPLYAAGSHVKQLVEIAQLIWEIPAAKRVLEMDSKDEHGLKALDYTVGKGCDDLTIWFLHRGAWFAQSLGPREEERLKTMPHSAKRLRETHSAAKRILQKSFIPVLLSIVSEYLHPNLAI
jgi:hypothetical protein